MNPKKKKPILVIGAGISGVTAAIKLQELGREVIILSKGMGATAMFSGSYDVASSEARLPISKEIKKLIHKNKNHPYAKIDNIFPKLDSSFRYLDKKLDLKLSKIDSNSKNMLLPTQYGTLKQTAIAEENLKSFDINGKRYGVAIFSKFKNFYHENLIENLNNLGTSTFELINFIFLKRTNDVFYETHNFAQILDNSSVLDNLIPRMIRKAKKKKLDGVIIPSILGLNNHDEIKEYLKKLDTNMELYETISLTPSVQGMRLQKKIYKFLENNKIKFLKDKVVNYNVKDKKITHIITKKGEEIEVSGVVLASGKFIGGGIIQDGNYYKESIFNLPLFVNNKKISKTHFNSYLKNDYFQKQPVFSLGISINRDFNPLDIDNSVIYENLVAAGNILQGYNYISGEGGMGVAIVTATVAAEKLNRYLGEL